MNKHFVIPICEATKISTAKSDNIGNLSSVASLSCACFQLKNVNNLKQNGPTENRMKQKCNTCASIKDTKKSEKCNEFAAGIIVKELNVRLKIEYICSQQCNNDSFAIKEYDRQV